MPGNPNYDVAGGYAFAVAYELKNQWESIWTLAWPFYSFIKGMGKNFNNANAKTIGTKMIVPLNLGGPVTSARQENQSTAFNAIAPTPTINFTEAEFYYATWANTMTLTFQERTQLDNNETTIASVASGKTMQLIEDMITVVNQAATGTQNCTGWNSTGTVMGELYPLSTSNSPGNISQIQYPVWAAQVNNVGGPFNTQMISQMRDTILNRNKGKPDFIQLSYNPSNNVYDKLASLIETRQMITESSSEAKFGFETFMYKGMYCFMDGVLGNTLPGSMIIGSTNSWWLNMPDSEPKKIDKDADARLLGTASLESFYTFTLGLGISDPGRNALISNIA